MDTYLFSFFVDINILIEIFWFGFEWFGFLNFIENRFCGFIFLDKYLFMIIYNFGFFGILDSFFCYFFFDWRKLFKLKNKKDGIDIGLNCECESCIL